MQAHAIEAIESLIDWFVWPALLHSLWIGLLAASIVALVFQAGTRLSHQARHAILLAAIALTILGPAVAALLEHTIASRPKDRLKPEFEFTDVVHAGNPSPVLHSTPHTPVRPIRTQGASRDRYVALFAGGLEHFADTLRGFRLFFVTTWLLGVAVCGGFLALGAKAVHRLRHEAGPASEPIRVRSRALARRLRLKKAPSVLVHLRIDEPCLTGLFRPAIILPARWLATTGADLLESILAHELAHARRHDHLVNVAQRLVEMVLFFHPAVHWLSRSLRRQREFCTDLLAVRVTRDPLALAKALESVALLRLLSPSPRPVGTSLGGQTTSLLPRIEELIGMKPSRPRPHLWPFAAVPAAGLIALVASAAGLAQDRLPSFSIQTQAGSAPAPRQESIPPFQAGALPILVDRAISDRDLERQICFEVRFASLDAEPWREKLTDRLELVKQEADVSAWIINETALKDLMDSSQAEATSNLRRAPKVTAFQNSTVTIGNNDKQHYVAAVERIPNPETPVFRPIVKDIDVGVRMQMKGSLNPRGIQFALDLEDKSLLAMHTLHRKDRLGETIVAAQYQIPTPLERRCQISREIPRGSSLVISLGVHERRGKSSNAVEAASGLLELVGLPPVPARSVTCERLVIITPRQIVLPPEESLSGEISRTQGN